MAGMGRTMITTSARNINTPWYIVMPNKALGERHLKSGRPLLKAAWIGLHWKTKGSSPEIVRSIKKAIIPFPASWIYRCGKTRMMKIVILILTAAATNRYVHNETYTICIYISFVLGCIQMRIDSQIGTHLLHHGKIRLWDVQLMPSNAVECDGKGKRRKP